MRFAAILILAMTSLPLASAPARSRDGIGMYEGYATKPWILRGLAHTESSGNDKAIGDDGISEGRMQLNRKFYGERAHWWGSFDPHSPLDSIRISSCLFQVNSKILLAAERCIDPSTWESKREEMAIAAHRQGLLGVIMHGFDSWYVDRVKSRRIIEGEVWMDAGSNRIAYV